MSVKIPSVVTDSDSRFTEDIINGKDLRDGMVVLITDDFVRDFTIGSRKWCKVTRLKMSLNNQIVSFVGVYDDGTKEERTYNVSYSWYIKTESKLDKAVEIANQQNLDTVPAYVLYSDDNEKLAEFAHYDDLVDFVNDLDDESNVSDLRIFKLEQMRVTVRKSIVIKPL